MSLFSEAESLASHGLLPLPAKGKSPVISWKEVANSRPSMVELQPHFKDGINIWIATGSVSGVVVIDCDNEAGEAYWREILGDALLDSTAAVKTAKGIHYYLSLPDGVGCPSTSSVRKVEDPDAPAWDVRGNGAGVIAPPSVHESGFVYHWIRPLSEIKPITDLSLLAPSKSGEPSNLRSMFTNLLDNPPTVGSRDVWLTKIGGHLAAWVPFEDAYLALLHKINQTLPSPLEPEEVDKKVGIFRSHAVKIEGKATAESGWLSGDGSRLYTECKSGDDRYYIAEWANFDLICEGVVIEDNRRAYQVIVQVNGKDPKPGLLDATVLASNNKLVEWLANYAATIQPPNNDAHKGQYSVRLMRYLEAQGAPQLRALDSLGWHDDIGFVVPEGIITSSGLFPHHGAVPNPNLVNRIKYQYGMASEKDTIETLREVLTYHDETVASVFGSWIMATLLKGQISTSLFPFMALEAPSGSGKTRGMFGMLVNMTGNQRGAVEATKAALRSSMSSHRNGVVWIDDVSDLASVYELVRQGTSEGSRVKMGADKDTVETDTLVSPVLLSGEGLGQIHVEKALLDRSIQLRVPDPTGRISLHGEYPQWDDMEALRGRYPDLSIFAGTLVRLALRQSHLVSLLPSLRGSAGRHYDKLAIVRLGSRVLAELTGDEFHMGLVDAWCDEQIDTRRSDTLVNEVIPWALRHEGGSGVRRTPAGNPACYIDYDGHVWFSEASLADLWSDRRNMSERTKVMGSLSAIQNQRRAIGIEKGTRKKVGTYGSGAPIQKVYYKLDLEYSRVVISHTGFELEGDAED